MLMNNIKVDSMTLLQVNRFNMASSIIFLALVIVLEYSQNCYAKVSTIIIYKYSTCNNIYIYSFKDTFNLFFCEN